MARYVKKDVYEPLPDHPNYGISPDGVVKNLKNGHKIQTYVKFVENGKRYELSVNQLIWQVYGRISSLKGLKNCPVYITGKNCKNLFFESYREAANFLARYTDFTVFTCREYLRRKHEKIGDYSIKYVKGSFEL